MGKKNTVKDISIKVLKSEKLDTGSWYRQIVIGGMEGSASVGHQLRSIMLSKTDGAAISAIRINGAKHEFADLSELGVREDLLEIMLNVKGISVHSEIKDTKYGRIKVEGPGVITADLIELPSGIQLHNPFCYIATISKPTNFEIEFKFENGEGYRINDSRMDSHEINPIEEEKDFIYIDSIFMPIRKVNYKVETVFDDNDNSCERLFLEIWTDGTLDPLDAYRNSCKVLENKFGNLLRAEIQNCVIFDLVKKRPVGKRNVAQLKKWAQTKIEEINLINEQLDIEQYKDISIEVLDLSIRPYNCLKKANINTIGELLKYSINQLMGLRNFGQKSANEVSYKLKNQYNITLK